MKEYRNEFTEFMSSRINASGMSRRQIVQRAGLELNYGYKILNGGRRTRERDYIVALCLAMHLSPEDTQQALRLNRLNTLDRMHRRDSAMLQALREHMSVEDANELLEGMGLPYLRTGRS